MPIAQCGMTSAYAIQPRLRQQPRPGPGRLGWLAWFKMLLGLGGGVGWGSFVQLERQELPNQITSFACSSRGVFFNLNTKNNQNKNLIRLLIQGRFVQLEPQE